MQIVKKSEYEHSSDSADVGDTFLPIRYFTAYSAKLPVYTDMQPIRH